MIGGILKALLGPILNKKILIPVAAVIVLVVVFFVFKSTIFGLFSSSEETVDPVASDVFVCPDGSEVTNPDDCPLEEANVSVSDNNESVEEEDSPETIVVEEEPEEVEPEKTLFVDITKWTHDEIVLAMSEINPIFRFPTKARLVYVQGDYGNYWYGSRTAIKEDPFWLLRNQYFHDSYEHSVSNLRTNVYEMPDYFLAQTQAAHSDAKLKILEPEIFAEWQEISCFRMESCRNLVAVNCTRGDDTLYVWNYFPEQGNTRQYRYSMSAMDNGAAWKTFEIMYCEPV